MTGHGPSPPERESYDGRRRVTLDLDDADALDVVRGACNLRDAGAFRVDCRVSSGGNGFHVRGWFDADDVDAEAVEQLRLSFGDHALRTELDRTHRLKPHQMLFTEKANGATAGPWRSDPWVAAQDKAMRRWRDL